MIQAASSSFSSGGVAAAALPHSGACALRALRAQTDCLACHGDKHAGCLGHSIAVDGKTFSASIHGSLQCNDCHADIKGYPHPDHIAPVECKTCHADQASELAGSVHSDGEGSSLHQLPRRRPLHLSEERSRGRLSIRSTFRAPAAPATATDGMAKKHGLPSVYPLYMDSIHGFALSKEGLLVAANCQSCHGSHHILSHNNPLSPTYKTNIPKTCGSCHAKINADYEEGIHGKAVAAGDLKAPGLHGLPHGARDSAAHRGGLPHAVHAHLRLVPQGQTVHLPRYLPLAVGLAGRLRGDRALLGLPRSARDSAGLRSATRRSTRPTW